MEPNVKPSISFKKASAGFKQHGIVGFGAINCTIRHVWRSSGTGGHAQVEAVDPR